eukprot:TRINITY_DN1233_c3_g1_i1.p1 TRINITY_DN1233_c3_g1~~TRINITY_DN1233_c3_g1_i1.p1  ORF type:complete len:221 (+),score=21.01 TRINITY_DN1233_c3_g1_i1:114-776(+)
MPMNAETAQVADHVLYSPEAIRERITRIADEIAEAHESSNPQKPLVLICLLNGAIHFTADLARELSCRGVRLQNDFFCVSSYRSEDDEVRVLMDLRGPIRDRDVLLCIDVMETGRTLKFLQEVFAARKPRSLRTAVLIQKEGSQLERPPVDHVAIHLKAPAPFVVGYGVGLEDRFRSLPDIVTPRRMLLPPSARQASQDHKPQLPDTSEGERAPPPVAKL